MLPSPTLFFTLKGNPKSESILTMLSEYLEKRNRECTIFHDRERIAELMSSERIRQSSVALFDDECHGKEFSMLISPILAGSMGYTKKAGKKIPHWTGESIWAVQISGTCKNEVRCANQIRGVFVKNFLRNMKEWGLPWGPPKKPKEHRKWNPYEGKKASFG